MAIEDDLASQDCAALERWTNAHPEDPRGWYYLARTYWHQGRIDLALAAFELRVGLSKQAQADYRARIELLARALGRVDNPDCLAHYLLAWEFAFDSTGEELIMQRSNQ